MPISTTGAAATTVATTSETANINFASGTSNSFSAYSQLLASSAAKTIMIDFGGTFINNAGAQSTVTIQIATGGAGSESVKWVKTYVAAANENLEWGGQIWLSIAAGTRISCRARASNATGSDIGGDINIYEV